MSEVVTRGELAHACRISAANIGNMSATLSSVSLRTSARSPGAPRPPRASSMLRAPGTFAVRPSTEDSPSSPRTRGRAWDDRREARRDHDAGGGRLDVPRQRKILRAATPAPCSSRPGSRGEQPRTTARRRRRRGETMAEVPSRCRSEAIAREEIEEDDEQQRAVRDDVGPGDASVVRGNSRAPVHDGDEDLAHEGDRLDEPERVDGPGDPGGGGAMLDRTSSASSSGDGVGSPRASEAEQGRGALLLGRARAPSRAARRARVARDGRAPGPVGEVREVVRDPSFGRHHRARRRTRRAPRSRRRSTNARARRSRPRTRGTDRSRSATAPSPRPRRRARAAERRCFRGTRSAARARRPRLRQRAGEVRAGASTSSPCVDRRRARVGKPRGAPGPTASETSSGVV